MRSDAPALMPIFRSCYQAELLAWLFLHPAAEYTMSDLAHRLRVPLNTLHREVRRLVEAELLRSRRRLFPADLGQYVDKRLSGVTAVQTLSRLNRTYPAAGKYTTYVLDFVNEPAGILASFKPYYREATLEEETDPDIVHDLQAKLDAAGIYTEAEVEAFVSAYLAGKHGAMSAPLKAAADRFNSRYASAIADADKSTLEELDLFRKDVGSFVRLYDFLS